MSVPSSAWATDTIRIPLAEYRKLAAAEFAAVKIRGYLSVPLGEYDDPAEIIEHVRQLAIEALEAA